MPERILTDEDRERSIRMGVNPIERGSVLEQWEFPEYEKHERGPIWYFFAILIGGGLLIYAIADGNFLFALIILLIALIVFTHHRSDPAILPFVIYETGVQIGDRFYIYREIESFAVIYEPPLIKQLYIKPKNTILRGEFSIPLRDKNPVTLRKMLLDFLDEDLEREEESAGDTAIRMFKL